MSLNITLSKFPLDNLTIFLEQDIFLIVYVCLMSNAGWNAVERGRAGGGSDPID